MVKFGNYLKENAVEEWRADYVNYKALKVLVYAIEMSNTPATEADQAFFKSRVTDEALRVESKYRQIRGSCMTRLAEIKHALPSEVQSYLEKESNDLFADDDGSAGVGSTITSSTSGTPSNQSAKQRSDHSTHPSSKNTHKEDEFSSSGDQVSSGAEDLPPPEEPAGDQDNGAEEKEQPQKPPVSDEEDEVSVAEEEAGSRQPPKSDLSSAVPISVVTQSKQDGNDDDEEEGGSEQKNESEIAGSIKSDGYLKSDEESKHDGDADTTMSPVRMYLGDSLYTHLPPSVHRDILGILQILANLKLFGWQNGEGLRKVIKKYDKRTQSNLTLQFWPDIQRMEFMNEGLVDSNISHAAAMLTTRVIPFGSFDVRELVVSGVNLSELSLCIQQLDTVSELASKADGLTEVIPMSVEPRSYMANERTFLKWMRMAALTAVMAVMLLNFQHEPVSGILLLVLSIFLVIRSFHEYRRRTESFLERVDHNWDDETGAKLLLVSVLLPMVVYLVYIAVFGLKNNRFKGLGLKGTVNSVSDQTHNDSV